MNGHCSFQISSNDIGFSLCSDHWFLINSLVIKTHSVLFNTGETIIIGNWKTVNSVKRLNKQAK